MHFLASDPDTGIMVPDKAVQVAARRWQGDQVTDVLDTVAEEWPVALQYNGISHAVMMATPASLVEFALGFSLTEGILASPSELYDVELIPAAEGVTGITVALTIAAARFDHLKHMRRNLTGRTGCGLCGAENLEQACRLLKPLHERAASVPSIPSLEALRSGMAALSRQQSLQAQTGGSHAAGWLKPDGTLALVREDVGRHNALDKLIGAMALAGAYPAEGAILVTSRASLEMVQKTVQAGVPVLAAVSAPTALAIRTAEKAGLSLLAFVRQDRCSVYTGSHHW